MNKTKLNDILSVRTKELETHGTVFVLDIINNLIRIKDKKITWARPMCEIEEDKYELRISYETAVLLSEHLLAYLEEQDAKANRSRI